MRIYNCKLRAALAKGLSVIRDCRGLSLWIPAFAGMTNRDEGIRFAIIERLGVLAAIALLAAACGSSAEVAAPAPPSPDTTEVVKIGNEVGNRLPNFELTLTDNGEKLTSTELVESGRPAFLFFFATT